MSKTYLKPNLYYYCVFILIFAYYSTGFRLAETFGLQLHDTYIVLSNLHYLLIIIVLLAINYGSLRIMLFISVKHLHLKWPSIIILILLAAFLFLLGIGLESRNTYAQPSNILAIKHPISLVFHFMSIMTILQIREIWKKKSTSSEV